MIRLKKQYRESLLDYKFIDLFCGIGGFHLALKSFGAKCVFACDINTEARKIYKNNFKLEPKDDIKKIQTEEIPEHDILCGGFPCQAFSISGAQDGFNDETTGKLFYEIIRIAKHYKPKLIFLENVANLDNHDKGATIKTILAELKGIGYTPFKSILNAMDYNVPQIRKRLYIVAFRDDLNITEFSFPEPIRRTRKLSDLLETDEEATRPYIIKRKYHLRDNYKDIERNTVNPYIRIGEIGLGRQGERIYSIEGCATTLSSSGGGLGGRTGIYLINNSIRKLTPRECARLMGFPNSFIIAQTPNQAYLQFGNSVVVNVLQHIIIEILDKLNGG